MTDSKNLNLNSTDHSNKRSISSSWEPLKKIKQVSRKITQNKQDTRELNEIYTKRINQLTSPFNVSSTTSIFEFENQKSDNNFKKEYEILLVKFENLQHHYNNKITENEKLKNEVKNLNKNLQEVKEILESVSKVNSKHLNLNKKYANKSTEEKDFHIEKLEKENSELRNKLESLETSSTKAIRYKYENEIKKLKEEQENFYKEQLINIQINKQIYQKEKEELIAFYNLNYINRNDLEDKFKVKFLKKIKEYEQKIDKLNNVIAELVHQNKYQSQTQSRQSEFKLNDMTFLTKNSEIDNMIQQSYLNEAQQTDVNLAFNFKTFLKQDFDTQYYVSEQQDEKYKAKDLEIKSLKPSFFKKEN